MFKQMSLEVFIVLVILQAIIYYGITNNNLTHNYTSDRD